MDAFWKWVWDNAQTLEALAALIIIPLLWLLGKIFLRKKDDSSPSGESKSTTFNGPVNIVGGGDLVIGDSIKHGDKNA